MRLALDSDSPAATVVSTRDFNKRRRNVNLVAFVVNRLDATGSCVVLIPSIAANIFALFAGISQS